MMKKGLFPGIPLIIPLIAGARENNSSTYNVVKITGIIVAAGFVMGGISRWRKRRK